MTPACTWTSSIATPTGRIAGCSPPRARRRVVVDPGFEPRRVHAILEAAGKRPVAVLLTHAHIDHAGAAGEFAGELPVYIHGAEPSAFADYPAGSRDARYDARPGRGPAHVRRRRRAYVRRVRDRGAAHPGHTPGSLLLPRRRRRAGVLAATWCSRARSAGRTSPTPTRRRCGRSCARFLTLPDELPVLPGHGRRRGRPRARLEPVPAGARLMELRAAAVRRTSCRPPGRMRALYDRAADLARCYGYRYVETPVFEATELFARTSGETSDVVAKEMYTFTDRGDRSLTLRPEGTAPVMRAYLHERTAARGAVQGLLPDADVSATAGRRRAGYREHRQFGVEVFGTDAPGRRRRGDRARRRVPAVARAADATAGAELDRRRGVPARLPRAARSRT